MILKYNGEISYVSKISDVSKQSCACYLTCDYYLLFLTVHTVSNYMFVLDILKLITLSYIIPHFNATISEFWYLNIGHCLMLFKYKSA